MNDFRLAQLRQLEELHTAKHQRAAQRAEKYLNDPVGWARDCIAWPEGGGLAAYQEETLALLPTCGRVAKRGPHGLGKTADMAIAVLWFALTRELAQKDWKVITTASVWRQLSVYLWPEIHKWANRIRWDIIGREPFSSRTELLALQLKMKHGAATAVASNDPARIEGAHADHIFYILDEAKIIPPATWDAIEGALSNAGSDTGYVAYMLAMSTPGGPHGRFYDIHRRAPGYEDWHVRHVTLGEAITAGRISRQWAEQRRCQWGENSAMYQQRVLGNFHADQEDSVIPLRWVEAAQDRWIAWRDAGSPEQEGTRWIGVDVGRGGDQSVLAVRHGPVIVLKILDVRDTMLVVDAVRRERGRPVVDVVGVGAGVFDRLKQLDTRPIAYAGSAKSLLRDRSDEFGFVNARSAAYWLTRELLDPEYEPMLCLPPDDLLTSDLVTPKWSIAPGIPPKIKVENKDDVVSRLGRSPDRGDAAVMSLYADFMRGTGGYVVPEGNVPTTSLSPLV